MTQALGEGHDDILTLFSAYTVPQQQECLTQYNTASWV